MESGFISGLAIKHIGGDNFYLLSKLTYQSKLLNRKITAQRLFISDGPSIPKWSFIKKYFRGVHLGPWIMHDWVYRTHEIGKIAGDKLALEAAAAVGDEKDRAVVMFLTVYIFGWWDYWTGPTRLRFHNE